MRNPVSTRLGCGVTCRGLTYYITALPHDHHLFSKCSSRSLLPGTSPSTDESQFVLQLFSCYVLPLVQSAPRTSWIALPRLCPCDFPCQIEARDPFYCFPDPVIDKKQWANPRCGVTSFPTELRELQLSHCTYPFSPPLSHHCPCCPLVEFFWTITRSEMPPEMNTLPENNQKSSLFS